MKDEQALVAAMVAKHYDELKHLGADYVRRATEFFPEPERTKRLERFLASEISVGRLDSAQETARMLGRHLRTSELKSILKRRLNGYSRLADTMKVARLLGRSLTTKELTTVFRRQSEIPKYDYFYLNPDALEAVKQLPPHQRTRELLGLLGRLVAAGEFREARTIARLLKRKLNKTELAKLRQIKVCQGSFQIARQIAKLQKRPLNNKELLTILQIQVANDWPDEDVSQVVNALPKPLRTKKLGELLTQALAKAKLQRSQQLAGELGRGLATEELITIFGALMSKNDHEKAAEIADLLLGQGIST